MTRLWLGLGSSLVLHAGVAALALALVRPEEPLPALVIDLREPIAAGPASVRPPQQESRPAPPARGPRPARTKTDATAAAPGPTAAPSAAPPVSEPEARPAPVVEAAPAPAPSPAAPAVAARPAPPPPPEPAVQAPPATSPSMSEPARDPSRSSREIAEAKPPDALAGGATPSGPSRSNAESGVAGRSASATSESGAGSKSGNATGATGPAPTGLAQGVTGSGRGSGQPGPAVAAVPPGGSGTGTAGAEYGPYLTALRQRIQQSLRYPASARRRGVAGTVSVEILILPNGTIGDVTLLESSTHPVLDEAALDTIRSLPRMPLPRDLPARSLRVRVPVVFEMR